MRSPLRLLVVVAVVATALSPGFASWAGAIGTSRSARADLATVERLLYRTTLDSFLLAVGSGDRWFDWSSDGCSAPLIGGTGRSFDFRASCRRHDFGYRNLQLLDARYGPPGTYWTSSARTRVDEQFLTDMTAHCRARRWYDEPTCRWWAGTFFAAVRLFGGP